MTETDSTTLNAPASPSPAVMLEMATAYWKSQAVYVAAKLGLADLLKQGPMTCAALARATHTQPASLFRLLRALVSLGVFLTEDSGQFWLAPLGTFLQSDAFGSMRSMVLTLGEEHYQAWGQLLDSVQRGEPAFNRVYGTGLFAYLKGNAEARKTFSRAMTDVTALISLAVAATYDFSGFSMMVEVGGGHGTLTKAILTVNPKLRGIVFDTPQVIEDAKESAAIDGLTGRCQLVGGDFFCFVPSSGDAYVMKNVIHDWDDDHSIVILENCRRAMAKHGKVLLVETLITPDRASSFECLMDLNMLVISGGRERSQDGYARLFEAAGLKLTRVLPTPALLSVIEGVPK